MSKKTLNLVYGASFTAIAILLSSFLSIGTPTMRITLAPLIIMLSGSILGPVWGAASGAVTDVLSYFIANRSFGMYFPGFTVTMALYGLLAGLLFYRKENGVAKISLGIAAIQTGCSLLLNTFWISAFMSGTPFLALAATRAATTYINCAIYIVALCILLKNRDKIFRNQALRQA